MRVEHESSITSGSCCFNRKFVWYAEILSHFFFTGSYVLSLRDYDATKGDCVKHYKMRNMENGGVYIAARRTFSSIIELVEHYKG